MMIAYDKARCETVDDETGDYLKVVQSHYSIPEKTMALYDKQGAALLVTELISNGTMVKINGGETLNQKWNLQKAFVPTKIYPPTNFEVPEILIQRLILFLKARLETEFNYTPPPQFEFIDARQNVGGAK